ncbi:hypothetical protein [Leptospira alexanderi]|nr:hypothetical protein [Leptospira alexanderi]
MKQILFFIGDKNPLSNRIRQKAQSTSNLFHYEYNQTNESVYYMRYL